MSPEFDIEQSVIIEARPESIHPYVNDLKEWPKWMLWKEMGLDNVVDYGDISKGVGASQVWQGPGGGGRLYITVSSPLNGIAYDEFLGKNSNPYICAIEYEVLDSGSTRVTWRIHGEVETSAFAGYKAVIVKLMIRDIYKNGLLKLKLLVEKPH